MLVFTRRRDEAIMIGDGIEVRVLRVGRDGVRLGVTAPSTVAVHRREVYDQIREENRTAAHVAPPMSVVLERVRRTAGEAAARPAAVAADARLVAVRKSNDV